ncbi:MAG: hypothetical protein L0Z71_05265 [Anaerolineae bacterium]|nr:hypothetical protein [Anaerolineae bacterium]
MAQTNLLNRLYDQLWLYHNFFQPVMRLHEKHVENGQIKRIYDAALPPLDRLCRTKKLTPSKNKPNSSRCGVPSTLSAYEKTSRT